MRPLRLTMQAFGPYPDRQVVDFADALKSGLFGVYGPTGAGKSSIFSAISFALFGKPAQGDQDPASLRSDHAPADTLTEVELIFDVGSHRYLVRRRPDQDRPALRGGGVTRERHCAWLFDITGIPLDEISEGNTGKALAEKKVLDVDAQIERLLHYGPEQFRQIVLLPQGRFETFLKAKTEDRLRILRDLFDVSLYRSLAIKLKDDAKAAREKIQTDLRVHGELLKREGCATLEGLRDAVGETAKEAEILATTAHAATVASREAAALLGGARQSDKMFSECDAARAALTGLQGTASEIRELEDKLSGAQLAQRLADVDQAAVAAQARVKSAEDNNKKQASAFSAAQNKAAQAKEALAKEQAKSSELAKLVELRSALERHRQTLSGAAEQRARVAAAKKPTVTAKKTFEDAQRRHSDLVRGRATAAAEIERLQNLVQAQAELDRELIDRRHKFDTARQYEQATSSLTDAQAAATTAQKSRDESQATEHQALAAFDRAEWQLAQAQAIHLAQKLSPGEACPVCGSHEHPAPAKGDAASAGLDAAFRMAKDALEKARAKHADAGKAHSAASATAIERKSVLDALARPDGSAADLQRQFNATKRKRDDLGAAPDLEATRVLLSQIEQGMTKAVSDVESAREECDRANTAEALALQALKSALSTIPEELREASALSAAFETNRASIAAGEHALQQANENERAAATGLAGAERDASNAASALALVQAESIAAASAFRARLAETGLSEDAYRERKALVPQIEALSKAIADHRDALVRAESRLVQAEALIANAERPEIATLEQQNETLAAASAEATRLAAEAKGKTDRLAALQTSLAVTKRTIEAAEAAYRPLGAVAAAMDGDNDAKVNLETFAIAAMFDRVLAAANLRLGPMSSNRYKLMREQEVGKGGGKRGLGIVVHDLHTGRARATSTLSGGESFQAALALALGLSDVIESVSGGIRLDMIFIDEGFGTLDSETLDQALQTLQDLVGQSRAVGLISHVELVQQVIPNGFQIEKTSKGSIVRTKAA
jgi:exonuclease SbcC